ncbi:related to transposase-Wolbachia endosymbiont [Serendipita indica DSM 11827]|uniref:Related to transposase-Wolbachia endosymbiont n=1 Tax=Serendipita indica (strain DSM 11827) TaxID=1109443 RepID=G4TKS2_SERID|nr:related to transposase-Wolbachia endosymbiont [Serendipita indica DSM 11827]
MRRHPTAKLQRVIELLELGKSISQTMALTGISKGSISRIRSEYCPNLQERPSGRPRKLSGPDMHYARHLIRSGQAKNAVALIKQLKAMTCPALSPTTIRRALRLTGWKPRKKVKKPRLTRRHRKARLDWAERHRHWTVEDWKRVLWSDETKVNRLGNDGDEIVWVQEGEGLNARTVTQTVKGGGGRIMVWGCIGWNRPGVARLIEGKMDAKIYTHILDHELTQSVKKLKLRQGRFVFQQDNDLKHMYKMAQNWFDGQKYKVMDWPAQSPDANPIENL